LSADALGQTYSLRLWTDLSADALGQTYSLRSWTDLSADALGQTYLLYLWTGNLWCLLRHLDFGRSPSIRTSNSVFIDYKTN